MTIANAHIHTPYSFSPFESIKQAVLLAKKQSVTVLGINDFNTVEGYEEFAAICEQYGIYPLFNIETVSLNQDDKDKKLHWNDPINPGVIYLCGKGLNYPLKLSPDSKNLLSSLWKSTQDRIWKILGLLNDFLKNKDIAVCLDYNELRNQYAKNSLKEQHVAKGLYLAIIQACSDHNQLISVFRNLFDDPSFSADCNNPVFMQNEIHNRLLKPGCPAFVNENQKSFPSPAQAYALILETGGIPCYPLLADDSFPLTDYEKDAHSLLHTLKKSGIYAIEFLSYRTSFELLKKYACFFYENGFCVTFGTLHNSSDIPSLIPSARNNVPFDSELQKIAYDGACIIAAHQEKHRMNYPGFIDREGNCLISGNQLKEFIRFGDEAIRKTTASFCNRNTTIS